MSEKKWEKSPQELIDTFYDVMSAFPEAELRKMFGYPCAFCKGNMFIGLHQRDLILRLSTSDREAVLNQKKGSVFAPMSGRIMKEYVTLAQPIIEDKNQLKELIARSLVFVKLLPPKKAKRVPSKKKIEAIN